MNEKILIIEDEQGIADTVVYALSSEGYDPVWAATGGEGLAVLQKEKTDLVILDIGLPDISGYDVIKSIRRQSDIPVLFLTARTEEIDRILGLELGADDYVVKPFSPREVAARVRAILRRSAEITVSGIDKNNENDEKIKFSVNPEKRQICYCAELLNLSRYEYEMLCLFISKPGWVFTRDQIMDTIWTEPEESFDRTVDAHIKTIRSKLKAVNPDVDPIVTHRGVGYSLKDDM